MSTATLSSVLGFALQVVLAHYYGTEPTMDAFLNASTVPVILFGIINGALISALVPIFSQLVSSGQHEDVRRVGSTVINVLIVGMTALAAIGWLLAPWFVPLIAHGFPPAEQNLDIRMVRWLMPGAIATSLSGVCAALLNAYHRFVASSLIWVASNIVTIAVVICLYRQLGIFALVLGTVLGVFAQFIVQLPSIFRYGLYRLEMDLHHPSLRKAWTLLLPISIGSGAGQVNLAFDRYFASMLPAGSTAAIGYTTKLAFVPIQIVAAAIGTVIFPLIASHFANSDRAGIRSSVSKSLRVVSFIVIPCAGGLIVLAHPIVQILFQRGAFGPAATNLCASLVPFACIPLLATSYNSVLGRACYACQEARLAVTSSTSAVFINVFLSSLLLHVLGAKGLLLANGVSQLLLAFFYAMLLWKLVGGFEWRPLLSSIGRIVIATSIMIVALRVISSFGSVPLHSDYRGALRLGMLIFVGIACYTTVSRALRIEELGLVIESVGRKLRRRGGDTFAGADTTSIA